MICPRPLQVHVQLGQWLSQQFQSCLLGDLIFDGQDFSVLRSVLVQFQLKSMQGKNRS